MSAVTSPEPRRAGPADETASETPDETPEITGIIVPVPEAQAFAPHPHITLLAPFRVRPLLGDDALHAEMREVFAGVPPFDFKLVEVRQFPDEHVYLAPEPDEPFRAMTFELSARFPDCPPYGGAFTDVIPHLTIDPGSEPELLPIEARATVAQLVYSYGITWDVIATFPLTGRLAGNGTGRSSTARPAFAKPNPE